MLELAAFGLAALRMGQASTKTAAGQRSKLGFCRVVDAISPRRPARRNGDRSHRIDPAGVRANRSLSPYGSMDRSIIGIVSASSSDQIGPTRRPAICGATAGKLDSPRR